jgi:hypothetical protein
MGWAEQELSEEMILLWLSWYTSISLVDRYYTRFCTPHTISWSMNEATEEFQSQMIKKTQCPDSNSPH